jgi:hypothetical protein
VIKHYVKSGEYLSLIGCNYGIPWQKIWDDPANAAFKEKRKDPNILYPGDELMIPIVDPAEYPSCATDQRHKFVISAAVNRICIVIRDELNNPIKGIEYIIDITGYPQIKEKTGDDGMVKAEVAEDLDSARLTFPQLNRSYVLEIGQLDPVGRITGVQQRLRNLGFDPGPIDGIIGPLTRAAISRFQSWKGMPATGRADKATREALEKAHEGRVLGLELEDEDDSAEEPAPVGQEKVEYSTADWEPMPRFDEMEE